MKQWLLRLFGGAGSATPPQSSTQASQPVRVESPSAPPGSADDTEAPSTRQVDLAFYRWLTDPVRGDAADAAETRILDEIDRLRQDPAAAGELVPRVPAVVPQLLKSLRDDSVSSSELARQIARDTVLVAEVLREANSPYFRSAKPVTTIDGAVMVLGENGLRILLARVAFRPIIDMAGGRVMRAVAPRLWLHADACALAASLLAPDFGADPFEAYLAGLMQGVGMMVAFRVIERLDQPVVPQSDAFCDAFLAGARELSAGVATHWELPPFVASAIVRAGRASTQPLAETLGRADLLARLRLLVDHAVYTLDDAPLPALLAGPAGRHFERLAAG